MFRKALLITFVSLNLLFFEVTSVSFAEDIIPSEEAHRLYAAANQLEEMQRFEEAKSLYQQVLQEYPNSEFAAGAKLHFSRFNVLSQIAAGNQAAADAEINEITAGFADHHDFAWYLYGIANQYEELKRYEEARNLYQKILQQCPNSSVAAGARLHFSRFNVLSQIVAGNQADAQAEINNIEANFQSHPDFPWYIYSVANQYEELKKDDKARAIYQRILQQYPDSPVAGGARLHFSRYNISSLISSGNDTAVQSEIDGIAADFTGHPDLQWYFSSIADQYEQLGKYSEADRVKSLYQQIIQNQPNGSSTSKAGLQYARAEVQFLIISQKYDEAKAALDKLIADFSDHPDLLDTLYEIAQRYEWSDRYEEPKSIYQLIIQKYPDSSLIWHAQFLVGRSHQDLAKAGVISQADADAKTKAAYQQLLAKYPDCKAEKAARRWLKRNAKYWRKKMHTKLQTAVLILGVAVVACSPAYACGPGNQPPVADLEAVPEYVFPDANVTLDGSASYDSDGTIVKYEWDFDYNDVSFDCDYWETDACYPDGNFDGITTHAYSTPGTYTPALRVTDDDSATGTATCTVYVYKVHNITQDTWYNTIQAALDDANDSDIIEAAEGTYYENIDFNGVSCTLRSTDPNDFDVIAATIIDGNDVNVVVAFNSNENSNTLLAGLTITNGTHGVSCSNSSSPVISKCLIYDNNSAGICSSSTAPPTVKNNWIYDNDKAIEFSSANSAATVRNNTIVDNTSYGIYVASDTAPTITNCILWKNNDELSGCSATYSCIKDINDANGTGNISSYPYFEDYSSNDFHLTWNSPCINRGDPNFTDANETDIDGDSRVVDSRVDMGADELNKNVLIKNYDFEVEDGNYPADWGYWLGIPAGTVIVDSNGYEGKCVKLTNNNSSSLSVYQTFGKLQPGLWYRISAMCKTTTGHCSLIALQDLDWKDSDGNTTPKWFIVYSACRDGVWYEASTLFHAPIQDDYGESTADDDWRVLLYGSNGTEYGSSYYDNMRIAIDNIYLEPYGWINEANVAESINFGAADDDDPNYHGGIIWNSSSMGDRCVDNNDNNITYRKLKKQGHMLEIKFPAFNLEPYEPNFPSTPMLLEIMYKDTYDDKTNGNMANKYDLVIVESKIGYLNLDPNYLVDDPNNRDYEVAHLGGLNDGNWKYLQYAFQKSDFQLLRAIDGKFTIKIRNYSDVDMPINYVSLKKTTQGEYERLINKQRELRGFYEVEMPPNNPDNPIYDDPNLVVFVRDIMRPVYKHTKPGSNEPNSISAFGCWGEVEPLSFSIYSENGVNELTVTVSDLVHAIDSNFVISAANDISKYHVVYDETRLGYTTLPTSYALLPDRLEKFSTLSIDANSSTRVWLKVGVPGEEANLSGGLYEGNATIKRAGEPNVIVPIDLTVCDVTLDGSNHLNAVYHCPHTCIISRDIDVVYEAYEETGFEPFIYNHRTHVLACEDTNESYKIDFNSTNFETALDNMMDAGIIEAGDRVFMHISSYTWACSGMGSDSIYKIVMGSNCNEYDPDLYSKLSDADSEPNFVGAFKKLLGVYSSIAKERGIKFIVEIVDEPGYDPYKRVISDRLYQIIKDYNDPNLQTGVTYCVACDWELPGWYPNEVTSGDPKYFGLGIYEDDVTENAPDGKLPALTTLVDYKVWAPNYEGYGYSRHYDPNDPNYYGDSAGYFGYYTTGHSHWRNPVYNRFLHGLFAFGSDSEAVAAYAMGVYIGDPFNDFDAWYRHIFPFTYPDFLYAYPTWSGELLYTIGGLEGIREGIKDAKYIATLESLIEQDPNDPNAIAANEYLAGLKSSINPNYTTAYSDQDTEFGYYKAILEDISDTNDPNDFEAFTEIRKSIADYIMLLK